MKEQGAFEGLKEVRNRVSAITALRNGALQIPIGVVYVLLGTGNAAFEWWWKSAGQPRLAPLVFPASLALLFALIVTTLVVFSLLWIAQNRLKRFYDQRVGAYSVKRSARDHCLVALGGMLPLAIIVMLPVRGILGLAPFPWFGLAFAIFLSLVGMLDRGYQRWYYPAIAVPLAGICFLPLMLRLPNEMATDWIVSTCFGVYGLTLILLGTIDHVNLMRMLEPQEEIPNGQTI